MLTRVARLQMCPLVLLAGWSQVMVVCREPVMVLWMIVIGVRVEVQRRELAR